MLDRIIRNVNIIDGTGKKAYKGEIGIKDGKIVTDPAGEAKEETDGDGLYLCPGFIDSHSHMDRMIGDRIADAEFSRLNQGVTTEMTGQCGSSVFPEEPVRDFLARAESVPKAKHYAFLAGHGAIRKEVMGFKDQAPTEAEMSGMQGYLREAMECGAFGLSSGLIYIPGVYANTDELIRLAETIRPYDGIYATHMRSEADHIAEGVREAIRIAEEARVRLVISHHKCMGRQNWGRSKETLRLIHEAIGRGLSVTMDQYPYEATSTSLTTSIPPEYFTEGYEALTEALKKKEVRAAIKERMTAEVTDYNCGYRNAGGFGGILITNSPARPEAEGMTVEAFAKACGKDPFEAYFDLLAENNCICNGNYFALGDEDIDRIYQDENTCVGSDAVFSGNGDHVHPRTYGTFVRSITRFAKERGLVTLEEAVRKQTSLTADRWGLTGKGRIADGMDADLVLFSYEELADRSTYTKPKAAAAGIRCVYVCGVPVFADGKLTGAAPGRLILKRM